MNDNLEHQIFTLLGEISLKYLGGLSSDYNIVLSNDKSIHINIQMTNIKINVIGVGIFNFNGQMFNLRFEQWMNTLSDEIKFEILFNLEEILLKDV